MLQQDDKHQALPYCPSPTYNLWVQPIVKLIVDLIEGPFLQIVADLFPRVPVLILQFDDLLLFFYCVGCFGSFNFVKIKPLAIDLET